MSNQFALGKRAIGICDRCGFQYRLRKLKSEVVKLKSINNRVCPTCWDKDHPQLQLGMYQIEDPQALRNPRTDTSYSASGVNAAGNLSDGSRVFEWGWQPIGGAAQFTDGLTPNALVARSRMGTVTVTIS